MNERNYEPNIYDGAEPYIHISFHPDDQAEVMFYLEQMGRRGFRYWINDGTHSGAEMDESIAEHIENSDFFLAFLSQKYLDSLDLTDELNYSRDVDKEYLLVYLEDVSLPAGLDMRFMRAQGLRAYGMEQQVVAEQLFHINGAERFFGISDPELRKSAEKMMHKLEELYPEHKIFALDAVDKQLAKNVSELYVKAGYPSAGKLLLDYGFSFISTDEARSMRNSVLYQPGFEPESIKPKIDGIIKTLLQDYPDHFIGDSLPKTHHSIHNRILGISVWLGYSSWTDLLEAYGFSVSISQSGRKVTDWKPVLEQLKERYKEKLKPNSMSALFKENADLAASLKTMSNRSQELFGMTLLQYFKQIGLVVSAEREKEEKVTQAAMKRSAILDSIRRLYDSEQTGYGTFAETEPILNKLIFKENAKSQILLKDCSGCEAKMKLPYGIHVIDKEAFAGQEELQSLIIPPTVKEIKESAFLDCTNLQELIFSEGLESIDSNAFENCTALEKIVFPSSLKIIGEGAFLNCQNLAEVVFQNKRISIRKDAFSGCVYQIESLQEQGASPAKYFELSIEKNNKAKITAYSGNEEVVIVPGMIGGHPIVSIDKGCFLGNTSVREIYLNDEIKEIKGNAFQNCTQLKKLHLPESTSKLVPSSFAGCINLEEVNIPDCVSEVPRGLFKECPISTLYIGRNLQGLSSDAFYKGEIEFGTGTYAKKRVLSNLVIDSENQALFASGTCLLSKDGTVLIAELGDVESAVIPEGVVEIAPKAYEKMGALREVVFPCSLKKIGEKAFAETNLTAVDFPASVEEIGSQAFSFCRQMNTAELSDGLKVIGQQAFEGCPIQDVYIPATVETLGVNSFLAFSSIPGQFHQHFEIDSANPLIHADDVAIYQASENGKTLVKAWNGELLSASDHLYAYQVEEGTTSIGPAAFLRCMNLGAITLPDTLCSIGDMAFCDCINLKEIRIPPICQEIAPNAFFGSTCQILS